ncbi:long-chain-fatty-acid--CoA ligase [Chengkuizengella axinellae]|uniref:Long-chain fatty acid--CoA ligase n=1 Tax=Chengkuizengella axinellae TaxID=3064388 RepID=A0ABT9J518_9BACL|nr:long-chain fatty acid--CoA ligase [Chengkuizengella sp. 2205SS18-9]MDP5276695.1 long-chain fatty acid--CoA ligase [Chengkuizengella sp. 2205SS18-9]
MSNYPWSKFYPAEIQTHLDYPDYRVTDYLKMTAEQYPNNKAIHFFGKEMSFQELLSRSYQVANGLKDIGVKKGDRVALMLPNIPQFVYSYFGILFAGGIVVQTNPLYVERELEYHFSNSGAKVIICLDLVYPRVKAVKEQAGLEHIITTSIPDALPTVKKLLYPLVQKIKKGPTVDIDYSKEPIQTLHEFIDKAKDTPVEDPSTTEDVAVLQYTGGTTGTPKGVMLTHKNLVANVTQCQAWAYQTEKGKEVVLSVVPLFHVYGMTICMLFAAAHAAKMVLIPKFDIDLMMKTIKTQRPTFFPGAPTLYQGIINHPKASQTDLSSIEICISGSAPLPLNTQTKFEELTAGKLVEGYGLSESSPVICGNPIWGKNVNGSIGVPWPNTDCKVVDPEGEEVKPGELGEIIAKGPQIMKGYWNQPAETAATLKDGWLYTGDMGYMDENGYFYVVDRKKDLIIAGGYNIYPRDVEEVLYEHPVVKEAIVLGVPDEYRGETVKAYIVKKEGFTISEEALDQYCRSKLAAYKVPRIYEFRDELPKSMVGKILRRKLKEEEDEKLA